MTTPMRYLKKFSSVACRVFKVFYLSLIGFGHANVMNEIKIVWFKGRTEIFLIVYQSEMILTVPQKDISYQIQKKRKNLWLNA